MEPWSNGTGWAKVGRQVACMENNAVINKNIIRKNRVLPTHNCKPTWAPPCIAYLQSFRYLFKQYFTKHQVKVKTLLRKGDNTQDVSQTY